MSGLFRFPRFFRLVNTDMFRYFWLLAFCLSWIHSAGQYTFQAQKFRLGNGNPYSQLQEDNKTNPK